METIQNVDQVGALSVQPPPPREETAPPSEETREIARDSETGTTVDTYA